MEEIKNIRNCMTSLETLLALDKRAVKDYENKTHCINQIEVLTIIREFIRCKNDLEYAKRKDIPTYMKEDIEVLEKFISLDKNMRDNKVESDYDMFCERICTAIENVLERNKELEEKNTELKEQFKKAIEYRRALEEDLFENSSNYVISKDKIRKKIDESNISDGLEGNIGIAYLKELLEE